MSDNFGKYKTLITGGTPPYAYTWSVRQDNDGSFPATFVTTAPTPSRTLVTPVITPVGNPIGSSANVQNPTGDQIVSGLICVKVTDSTGGVANPATNLVTYGYWYVNAVPNIN